MCPSCKVMIVRSEGCKFMECAKCQYQFCWLCLSEFYTEYHYYESLCPLRIIPIWGALVLTSLLISIKLYYYVDFFSYCIDWIFGLLMQELLTIAIQCCVVGIGQKLWSLFNHTKRLNQLNKLQA